MREEHDGGDGAMWRGARGDRASAHDAARVEPALPGHGRGALRGALARTSLVALTGGRANAAARALPHGGERAPWAGDPDGGAERAAGGRDRESGPRFNRAIAPGGYQWLYLDGLSDDGTTAIVIIALLGSPFSPHYARARRDGNPARALDFCAMNVAIYGPRGRLWALRERRIDDDARDARSLAIGRSAMRWEGDRLVVDLDELTSPFPRALPQRVRGRITFRPAAVGQSSFPLDEQGQHTWWPIAPMGRLEVELQEPNLRFTGHGYHDANAGDAPLESAFSRWSWSRARLGDHGAAITYDVVDRLGRERSLALHVDHAGGGLARIEPVTPAEMRALPSTLWRIPRSARTEGPAPRVHRELEDGPFYARTLVDTHLGGRPVIAMHETMSLDRLAQSWVRFLLGFKIGRA